MHFKIVPTELNVLLGVVTSYFFKCILLVKCCLCCVLQKHRHVLYKYACAAHT